MVRWCTAHKRYTKGKHSNPRTHAHPLYDFLHLTGLSCSQRLVISSQPKRKRTNLDGFLGIALAFPMSNRSGRGAMRRFTRFGTKAAAIRLIIQMMVKKTKQVHIDFNNSDARHSQGRSFGCRTGLARKKSKTKRGSFLPFARNRKM